MASKTISIPTLNCEMRDFEFLFKIFEETNYNDLNIIFDFNNCSFLRQNAVAFLGGLAVLIKRHNGKVSFNWKSLKNKVQDNLFKNGFLAAFGHSDQVGYGNTIPYQQHNDLNKDSIMEYLKLMWLGRGWLDI